MEIRRAILLFAVVLGLAALVTSFTRPADDRGADTESTEPSPQRSGSGSRGERDAAAAAPGRAAGPLELRFPAGARPTRRSLRSGRPATLVVETLAPGQVAIEGLGLDAPAAPGTPARFDVLIGEPGRHTVVFTPPNGADGRTIGVLRVRE